MSDVNIKTSWDSIPANDSEYNTVVGVAGYDPDDNRLFLSAQQTPNPARNVTTEYARGFSLNSGYDGITRHDAITETAADLKTVKFTMSMAGTAYDLTDARCYVQFKNHYTVDIASWALQAQAEDDTLTTIATGGAIAAGAAVQIDFKNDYNAVRFIMTITYSGEASHDDFVKFGFNTPADYVWASGLNTYYPYSGFFSTDPGGASNVLPDIEEPCYMCRVGTTIYGIFENPSPSGAYNFYRRQFRYDNYNSKVYATQYDGLYVINSNDLWNSPWASSFPNFSDLGAALDAFRNAPSGGLNTADLSDYTGSMWQCRMIANVAAISPGPMATESEGGTEGDFDITSDQITAPALPTTVTVGGVRLYRVTAAQLNDFRDYIWNPDILNSLFNNFSDRANGIMSIMQVPTGTYPDIAADQHILIGNSEVYFDDLQGRHYATGTTISRYGQVDCGTVALNLFWDSALDLNPYTKLTAYIPCVGTVPLNADEVMGHTIGLYYNIDFLSGAGVAVLTIDGDYLAQYPCNMSTPIGISGEQYSRVYQSMIAAMASGAIGYAAAGTGGALAGAVANTASALMTSKIDRERAGNFGAGTALMAQLQPYIEILRPIQQLPRDYTKFNAYPSYMTAQLINLSGYVEVQDIRLDDIDCTDAERTELLNMLQSGVIL